MVHKAGAPWWGLGCKHAQSTLEKDLKGFVLSKINGSSRATAEEAGSFMWDFTMVFSSSPKDLNPFSGHRGHKSIGDTGAVMCASFPDVAAVPVSWNN